MPAMPINVAALHIEYDHGEQVARAAYSSTRNGGTYAADRGAVVYHLSWNTRLNIHCAASFAARLLPPAERFPHAHHASPFL